MKLTTSVFGVLAALALAAQAATVTVQNFPGGTPVPVIGPDGAPIASGSGSVALGIFTGDVGALAGAGNIDGLKGAFTQFGNAVSVGFNNIAGLYQNTISGTVGGSAFSGQNVYTVVGNASDIASSTALLVVDHGFTFVDEPGATPDAILRADSNVLLGTAAQGSVGGNMFDGYMLAGEVIPEPSTAMLGLLGLSFLFFRRRK